MRYGVAEAGTYRAAVFLIRPASSIIGLKMNSAESASKTNCVQSGRRCLVEMHNRSVITLNAITYEGSGCSDK